MKSMVPFYVLYISVEMCSGALRGVGEAIVPTILSLIGICFLRVIWIAVVLPYRNEVTTVVWSYPVTWTVTSLLFLAYYGYVIRKKLRKQSVKADELVK